MDNKARKKAEAVKPENRLSEIERHLLAATENNKIAAEQLDKELANAKEAINETVKNSGLQNTHEQQKLMQTVQQVYALLERAKKGENIIEELNKLRL